MKQITQKLILKTIASTASRVAESKDKSVALCPAIFYQPKRVKRSNEI